MRAPGNNNVDLNATEGDFQIGNASTRLKIGVGPTAAYTGNVNFMAADGSSHLALIATGGATVYNFHWVSTFFRPRSVKRSSRLLCRRLPNTGSTVANLLP